MPSDSRDCNAKAKPMIEVMDVSHSFGPRIALDHVSFSVPAGEVVALSGPNGAGKTTLLRILATLTRPSSGRVLLLGRDPTSAGHYVRRQVGFVSHQTLLYEDLTAEQNLCFYARLYGIHDAHGRVDEVLQIVGLADRRRDLVRALSHGMTQRLSIARAILHKPSLLLLDEPGAGLDAAAASILAALLARVVHEGHCALMATHRLSPDCARRCTRLLTLIDGQLVADERMPISENPVTPPHRTRHAARR
jgi:heme exporter protein A